MLRIAGFAIILTALSAVSVPAARSKPAPCPGGTFAVKGSAPVTARVVFTSSQVWLLDLCNEPAAANLKARRKVTNLSAVWTSCSDVSGQLALKAKIRAPACTAMSGGVKAKKAKPRQRAVPVLVDWLEQNLFGPFIWATDFVTHTIKVLDGQTGINTDSYSYLVDEKLDALMQAHAGPATGASARARGVVPLAAPPLEK